MKLISCYIENFGKLSSQSYQFNNGINSICEENGWGKSTLAVFIRVMFYGFLNGKSRNEITNERKHYRPWQEGVYGGKITFETGGKIYEMQRTFGIKENEDEFVLRDKKSNLVCHDYTKNIGEELFQIDVNSFMRTVYISQNDCAAGTTSGINAKIGNLTENTDDINNYDTAAKRLNDLLNSMSPTRKTGSLYQLKDEIAGLKYEVDRIGEVERKMEEYILIRDRKKKDYEDLKNRQMVLSNERKKISRLNDDRIIYERYKLICEEYSEKKNKVEYLRSLFSGDIPDMTEIDSCIEENTKLSSHANTMKIYELSEEERRRFFRLNHIFENGANMPDREEAEDILDKINEIQKMNMKKAEINMTAEEEASFQKLLEHFKKGLPDEDEVNQRIREYMLCQEKKNSLESRKAALYSMKSGLERDRLDEQRKINELKKEKELIKHEFDENKSKIASLKNEVALNNKKLAVFFGIGIIFIMLAVVSALVLKNKAVSLGFCAAFAICFLSVYFCTKNKKRLMQDMSDRKSESRRLLDRVKEISEYEKRKNEKYKEHNEKNNEHNNEHDNIIAGDFININHLKRIENEITEDEIFIRKAENQVGAFAKKYYFKDINSNNDHTDRNNNIENAAEFADIHINEENSTGHMIELLYKIKSDLRQYETLLAKKEMIDNSHYDSQIKKLSEEINKFIARFYDVSERTTLQYESVVRSIIKDQEDFILLYTKCKNLETAKQEYEASLKKVKAFLEKLSTKTGDGENIGKYLMELKGHLSRYIEANQEFHHISDEKADFEKQHKENLTTFEEEKENFTTNMQSIDENIEKMAEKAEMIQKNISDDNGKLSELRERFDELTEKSEELKGLEEKYQSGLKKYHLLKQTKDLLEKSKNSFTAKYMQPVMSGFLKYYHIIDGGQTSCFHIDAKTNITVDEKGMQREFGMFSTGRQDLLGVCMRMALIHAMYTSEKPVVIFDDPFVNLDNERVKGGMRLLENIAKEYQVIYFTCHESRNRKGFPK
ncbi:MAG: AAA family ATPase [Lachnospiraceae bacterium]|nr:AAA family ATPase [Lachnospiraceae bacterium]